LLLITTIMLPPRAAQASTWLNGDRLPFNGADAGACAIRNGALLCWGGDELHASHANDHDQRRQHRLSWL
jgi:hypothetical protein